MYNLLVQCKSPHTICTHPYYIPSISTVWYASPHTIYTHPCHVQCKLSHAPQRTMYIPTYMYNVSMHIQCSCSHTFLHIPANILYVRTSRWPALRNTVGVGGGGRGVKDLCVCLDNIYKILLLLQCILSIWLQEILQTRFPMPRYIVTQKGGSQVYIQCFSEHYKITIIIVLSCRLVFSCPKWIHHRLIIPCQDGER